MLGKSGCGFAQIARLFLSAQARWPVAHYDAHFLAAEQSGYAHLVAGAECGIVGDNERGVGDIEHAEHAGVIEQTHIHAATVGRVVVHYLQVPAAYRFLLHEVLKHGDVFDFRHAYHSRTAGGRLGGELAYGISHIGLFAPIFLAIPLLGAFGRKFQVVGAVAVDGVEEVFEIIKSHAECLVAIVGILRIYLYRGGKQGYGCYE